MIPCPIFIQNFIFLLQTYIVQTDERIQVLGTDVIGFHYETYIVELPGVKPGIIPLENGLSYSRIVSDSKDNPDLQSITKSYQGNNKKPALKAYIKSGKCACSEDEM